MAASDKEMVKLLIRGFAILSKLTSCYNLSEGMQDAIQFTSRSLDRISETTKVRTGRKFKNVDPWKGVGMKKDVHIDRISDYTIEMVWFAMKFSRIVNGIRKAWGRKEMDFLRESAAYDLEVKRGERQSE